MTISLQVPFRPHEDKMGEEKGVGDARGYCCWYVSIRHEREVETGGGVWKKRTQNQSHMLPHRTKPNTHKHV